MDLVVSLLAVSAFFAHPDTPLQAGSTPAAGQSVRACAVLTKDLVAPFTENKKVLDILPPSEEELGTSGTACEYGAVRLQLFPGRGGKPTVSATGLEPVTGAGDGGLFRSNRNRYAELMVWTNKYRVDLQVSVPSGGTAEAIKPDVLALANAILKKLP